MLFLLKKMLGPNKKILGQKELGPKNLWSKKNVDQKNKVQKYFGFIKILGKKNCESKKFWIQKFLVKRSGSKNLSQKRFVT